MTKEIHLELLPHIANQEHLLKKEIIERLGIENYDIMKYRILKKSIDARHGSVLINLWIKVYLDENISEEEEFKHSYRNVSGRNQVIVVGSGPAGLFSALRLIESGMKPIVLERGNDVNSRKKDIALISTAQTVNPESNYCFGEGGAGTFSDGKLYTRSGKRGNAGHILQTLHFHGANPDILYEAHPHIGTDKLPEIIKNIRQTIIDCGGEIHFNTKVTDLLISENIIKGVTTSSGVNIISQAVILATGHSARDIYEMLNRKSILIESKPFAMGVRVEHPQQLIDQIQYHNKNKDNFLPAAIYNLVTQVDGRGVYSFCMCPGGYIVPSSTCDNEIVVNGMSSSRRHTKFANSGIVVEIIQEDFTEYKNFGALAGLKYQQYLETLARQNGGRGQVAPAQRLTDFINNRISSNLPESSYTPGIVSSPLHFWLPSTIAGRLQKAFLQFDKKMKGYNTNEAYITGIESRTSSPVRIPRNTDSLQHPVIKGLFPCGEGSGYAGGIVSSAMDGENVAEKVKIFLNI